MASMQNGTMIQYFHWYTPENVLWKEVKEQAPYLASLGISSAWLPPAYKANAGGMSVGYDAYDLFDLGEFDQKGSVRTKYGTRAEYEEAAAALRAHHIQVIVDIVLNHKAGGDETERVMAFKVHDHNRNHAISDAHEIEAFTKFTFPGRQGKYSNFIWDHMCFTGVDFNGENGEVAVYSILNEHGPDWEEMVGDELGNYDYLMYSDIEFRNPAVREELVYWGKWYHDIIQFDGVRLDALKHMPAYFFNDWLKRLRAATGKEIFAVGEYWSPGNTYTKVQYLEATKGNMSLFDASLHHRFYTASRSGNAYDMRAIFDDTLVQILPHLAVTIVDNHDTQPLQSLEAPVEPWFKPIAYALILLREAGYPCVFYPDLYGATYTGRGRDGQQHEVFLPKVDGIEAMLRARSRHAFGVQRDYFDHMNCIGWTLAGDDEHSGLAVVLSNGDAGVKAMEMGTRYAGKTFVDILGKRPERVPIGESGWGEFYCAPGTVSVWVEERVV